jgi:tetratricopeptide (TPR) repeat protein
MRNRTPTARRGQYFALIFAVLLPLASQEETETLLTRAAQARASGAWEDALEAYRLAFEAQPSAALATSCGEMLYELERFGEALEAYELSLELHPEGARIWGLKGEVLLELSRYSEAVEALDRSLALDSNQPYMHAHRGAALYELERYAEARNAFAEALRLRPGLPSGLEGERLTESKLRIQQEFDPQPSLPASALPSRLQRSSTLRSLEGPLVLHRGIEGQWGGHSLSYLVAGERGLFWTALEYDSEESSGKALVGQSPYPGDTLSPMVQSLEEQDPAIVRTIQPQLVRTRDGYLHLFQVRLFRVDSQQTEGRIRYLRSAEPESVQSWVDRSDLLPRAPYRSLQIRQNIGLSEDGSKLALVTLSTDSHTEYNTPVLFVADRDGKDFRFRPPVAYLDAMSLFYPQVAATRNGIVILGQLARGLGSRALGRLVHVDEEGKLLQGVDLPASEAPGRYWGFELRPRQAHDWRELVIVSTRAPDQGNLRHLDFWTYDTVDRKLRSRRSVVNHLDREESFTNAGKWFSQEGRSWFLNNPHMGPFQLWEGDVLGSGPLHRASLDVTAPAALKLQASRYCFVPNPLQGSVAPSDRIYFAVDYENPGMAKGSRGPCSLLLWALVF